MMAMNNFDAISVVLIVMLMMMMMKRSRYYLHLVVDKKYHCNFQNKFLDNLTLQTLVEPACAAMTYLKWKSSGMLC